jgi:hypothetical protein
MKLVQQALAVMLAVSFGARAEEAPRSHGSASHAVDTGLVFLDVLLDLVAISVETAAIESQRKSAPPAPEAAVPPPPPVYAQRAPDDGGGGYRRRGRVQARQGLLLSLGVGGGSMYTSTEDARRTGAFDLDFRLGYGFSDRFQFFMDLGMDAASYNRFQVSDSVASWTFTFRGQTVLFGDRAGNGLNLNFGLGLGGVTYNSGYLDETSSPAGLAVAGGLSYDARVSPWFAISPEFFYTWHAIPTDPGARDAVNVYGLRVNFLWYLN